MVAVKYLIRFSCAGLAQLSPQEWLQASALIRLEPDQFVYPVGQPLGLPFRKPEIGDEVLASEFA